MRVTYVNGAWQGKLAMDSDHAEEVLNSSLEEWEYLRAAGTEGWDLVGVAAEANLRTLYLRREQS